MHFSIKQLDNRVKQFNWLVETIDSSLLVNFKHEKLKRIRIVSYCDDHKLLSMQFPNNFYECTQSISEWVEKFNPFLSGWISHILYVKYLSDNLGRPIVSDCLEGTLYKLGRLFLAGKRSYISRRLMPTLFLQIQIFEKFDFELQFSISSLQKWVFVKGQLLNVWLLLVTSKTFDRWSGKFVITFARDVFWMLLSFQQWQTELSIWGDKRETSKLAFQVDARKKLPNVFQTGSRLKSPESFGCLFTILL